MTLPHAALALVLALSAPLSAVGSQTPSRQEADAAYQAQDWTTAAKAYAAVVEAQPDDGAAWHRLGYALHAQGRYEDALAAHARAATFPAGAASSAYNAACACARLGRTDGAFTWLEKAVAAGFANANLLASDADLDSLRSDPRLRRYLPGEGAAEACLREPSRVLLDLLGEAPGDTFGWIARALGDVDGDGAQDFVTSAPYKTLDGPFAGRVYAYSGRTGEELFRLDGAAGDYLGAGVEAGGDANGDGVPDVLAGAPRWKGGAGVAHVVSGKDGAVLRTLTAGEPGDRFGHHVMGVGDLDGDGCGEQLVGAPYSAAGGAGAQTGRAYLYSGRDGELLATLAGEAAGDQFGSTVGGAHGLLLVGAPQAGAGQGGRVYVYRFADGAPEPAFVVEPDGQSAQLGAMFVSVVGDVDGDGTPDVYSSDWQGCGSAGRVFVHSGASGELLHDLRGEQPGDGFGIGTAEAGDVDGDGCDDLVIGAWQSRAGAPAGGRTYLFSGRTGERLRTWTCTLAAETFGFDATGLGDVDGDGAIDFLVTSAQSNLAGKSAGRVLVLAGGAPEPAAPSRAGD